jgi:hypothetical protein
MTDGPISTRRRWGAIGAATAAYTVSFWMVIYAFDRWLGGESTTEAPPMTTDVALILGGAFLFLVGGIVLLALLARHEHPWRATLYGAALAGSIWLWVPFLVNEPVTPMVAAFGGAGILALPPGEAPSRWIRIATVIATASYIWLFYRVIPPGAVLLAPFLPLPLLGWADALAERRTEEGDGDQPKRR